MFRGKNENKPITADTTTAHDHQELSEREWEKSNQNAVIEALQAGVKISEILPQLPGFQEAFHYRLDTLDCSDGRVCSGHKLGLAGVGILLSPAEWDIVVRAIKDKHLTVTGHDECGAAALAFPGPTQLSDWHGYDNAQKLAQASGSDYHEVHREDFRCAIHNERSLVIEATGRFDCANWPAFPPQFISSAPFLGLPDSYLQKEIIALTRIALGDHGFGAKFTPENPFYLIVSANNEQQLDRLREVAQQAATEFGELVKIDGFVAPAKEAD
jgi:hypothetical protein